MKKILIKFGLGIFMSFFIFSCSKKVVLIEPTTIQPEQIAFNYAEIHLTPNNTSDALKIIPTPLSASVDDLVWSSADTSIVSISGEKTERTLIVSANARPNTKVEITAKTKDGKLVAKADVQIVDKKVATTGIHIVNSLIKDGNISVENTTKAQFLISFEPKETTDRDIEWTIKNKDAQTPKNQKVLVDSSTGVVTIGANAHNESDKTATLVATLKSSKNKTNPISAEVVIKPVGTITPREIIVSTNKINFLKNQATEQKFEIYYVVKPDNASDKQISTGTNNLSDSTTIKGRDVQAQKVVVTIAANRLNDFNGNLILRASGDSSVKQTIKVASSEQKVNLNSITINEDPYADGKTLVLNAKNYNLDASAEEFNFTVTYDPANATNKNLIWSSSDEEIAKVTDGYVHTGTKSGEVTIKVVPIDNPSLAATKKIKVIAGKKVIGLSDIEIVANSDNKFYLFDPSEANEVVLQADISPADATNNRVSWFSTDPASVKVIEVPDTGGKTRKAKVKFVGNGGEATIVAITQDGRKFKTIKLRSANKLMVPLKIKNKNGLSGDMANIESFEIAKTEMIFTLWEEVFKFATTPSKTDKNLRKADGGEIYRFGDNGVIGNLGPSASKSLPVAGLNYLDTVAFSNALTEYMNYRNGAINPTDAAYIKPYYLNPDESIFRKSSLELLVGPGGDPNKAYIEVALASPSKSYFKNSNSAGFRLPTKAEWILAASLTKETDTNLIQAGVNVTLIDATNIETTYNLLKTNQVSGRTASNQATDLAYFNQKFNAPVLKVASKAPNALGLYDMSGNLSEYVFKDFCEIIVVGNKNIKRCSTAVMGGKWYTQDANIGNEDIILANSYRLARQNHGFRLVRTIK